MKWLIPVVLATLALALAVWLPREPNDSELLAQAPDKQESRAAKRDDKAAPDVARDESAESADQADREAPDADEAGPDKQAETAAKDVVKAPAGRGKSRILVGKVVVFNHIRAEIARDILRKTFPDPFEQESNTNVDAERNALVFSAPAKMLRPVEEFLTKLDEAANDRETDVNEPGDLLAQIKILRLKQADAAACQDVLADLYADLFRDEKVSISTDARTNSLVVRGPKRLLDLFGAIVVALDESQAAEGGAITRGKRVNAPLAPPGGGTARPGSSGGSSQKESAQKNLWIDPATGNQYFVGVQADGARLEEYRQYELQAEALAKEVREAQTRMKPDDPELRRLKADLEGAVHSAFHARQAAQRAQLDRMRKRIEQIDRRVKERAGLADEIIRRRVEELISPERQWDLDQDASGSGSAGAEPPPEAGDAPVPGAARARPAPTAIARAGDPRPFLLDAENAVLAARAALATRERALKGSEAKLARFEKLHDSRAIEAAIVDEARNAYERDRAELDEAKAAVKAAERQLALAREELASQVKLLELDLEDAKLQFDHARKDEARAENLFKRNAIAIDEYDRIVLAVKQAQLKVERAQIKLDLYRKALPDAASRDKADDRNE